MEQFESAQLGVLEFEESTVVQFPAGLPAFEHETRFLLIERNGQPLVFLQSLLTPSLLFMALPARLVAPDFRLELMPDERRMLGVAGEGELREGVDLIALVILTARQGAEITANLLAPVVIGAHTRRAVQTIQVDSGYRVDHPLATGEMACL